MKRSRLVSLTLLTPAMLAFGCGQQPPPLMRPVARVANPNDGERVQCDVPAKPGEPAKQPCQPGQNTGATGTTTRTGSTYFHRPIYRPSYVPGGSDSTRDGSSARSTSPASSSRSTFGGFGSFGSRMSGGS